MLYQGSFEIGKKEKWDVTAQWDKSEQHITQQIALYNRRNTHTAKPLLITVVHQQEVNTNTYIHFIEQVF